jgi:hypothetical protein
MKLNGIIFGQVIRFLDVSGPSGGTIYGVNLTRACEQRYGFLQGPRVLQDYDPKNGITFLHGYFDGKMVIDKFSVYDSGLLVEAKVDTDECDAFLDDIVDWAQEIGGITIAQRPEAPKLYYSQLEVQSDVLIARTFPGLKDFGAEIANILRSYGQVVPDYEVSGIHLHGDVASHPGVKPIPFKLERREGVPFASGVYFSTSPFKTKDHFRMLEELERIFG